MIIGFIHWLINMNLEKSPGNRDWSPELLIPGGVGITGMHKQAVPF